MMMELCYGVEGRLGKDPWEFLELLEFFWNQGMAIYTGCLVMGHYCTCTERGTFREVMVYTR